jgi:conjugative transfer pilus assembly protein TraH
MYANVTGPDVVKGQMGGTLSGGGLYLRSPRRSMQVFAMDPPRFTAGCGGIDAYMGSFSFISGEKLTQFIRSVAQNAPPLLFKMAIETMSPQLGAVLSVFQKMAQDMNATNLNSCTISQGILKGDGNSTVMGRLSDTMSSLTDAIKGYATDFANAAATTKANPQAAGNRLQSDKDAAGQPKDSGQGNFTWKAIKRSDRVFAPPPVSDDVNEGHQIMMSMVGTQITENPDKTTPFPPILNLRDVLGSKVRAGETTPSIRIYKCDTNTDCLNPVVTNLTYEGVSAYINRKMYGGYSAAVLPGSIIDRLLVCSGANCGLDAAQKAFLNGYANVPVVGTLVKLQRSPNLGLQVAGELVAALSAQAEVMYAEFLLSRMQLLYANDTGMKYASYDDALKEMAADVRALDAKQVNVLNRLNTIFQYVSMVAKGSQSVKK